MFNSEFKSTVFKTAHQLPKSLPFSLRLKKAWALCKLKVKMQNEVVEFSYSKKDGTTRKAVGTLLESHITYKSKGTGRPTPNHLVKYWDVEKGGYRAFIKSNII